MNKKLLFPLLLIPFLFYGQNLKSLKDCIYLAKTQNIKVLQQKYLNLKSEHDITIAKGTFLPNLNFKASQDYNLGKSFNVSTGVGQQESSSNLFNLSSSVVLFDGLANVYKYQLSKFNLEKGNLQLKSIEKKIGSIYNQ